MNSISNIFMVLAIVASILYAAVAGPPLQVVNGTTAAENEFPYMVQLRGHGIGMFSCGGAIIAPQWILTAGHCVASGEIDSIVYGTNKLYNYMSGYPNTSIFVEKWYEHPNRSMNSANVPIYDIGLLQLKEPIPFSDSAKAVQLPKVNANIPFHKQGVLAGWGMVESSARHPAPYLLKVNRILLTDNECSQRINDADNQDRFIATHHLCSNDTYDGACYGDSGGPLVIKGIAYGITSWMFTPCGVIPGIYSRITNPEYRNWIKNVTNI